ncbi:hypothetical protein AB9K41_19320, partial [Cribrihabitans sp. XS_ASV171]
MFDSRSISANATQVEVFRLSPRKVIFYSALQEVDQIRAVMRSGEYPAERTDFTPSAATVVFS